MRFFVASLLILLNLSYYMPSVFAMYGSTLCRESSDFDCVKIKSGQSWDSLWPDQNERDIVKRVNRLNIDLWAGMIIAVPKNLSQDSNLIDYSPFPQQIVSSGEKLIIIDPKIYAWGAYDADGRLIKWGPSSSGADWCSDIDESCQTREGEYRIFSLGGSTCISHKFPLPEGGALMPYCMYFNSGQALHGEPNGLPGYNASHGCVRLYVDDAEWLRYDFVEPPNASNQYHGTKVVIEAYEPSDSVDDQSMSVYE